MGKNEKNYLPDIQFLSINRPDMTFKAFIPKRKVRAFAIVIRRVESKCGCGMRGHERMRNTEDKVASWLQEGVNFFESLIHA